MAELGPGCHTTDPVIALIMARCPNSVTTFIKVTLLYYAIFEIPDELSEVFLTLFGIYIITFDLFCLTNMSCA